LGTADLQDASGGVGDEDEREKRGGQSDLSGGHTRSLLHVAINAITLLE
jgi:hypothetical protein